MTSTSRIIPGSQYFADPAVGRPVANGKVYIGAINTDPFILANRVTVDLIKQDGSTVSIAPASQPIRTTGGGLLSYSGSAVQAQYTGGDYSISLRDANDVLLDYFPRVSSPFSADAPTLQADNFYTNDVSSASNAYVIIPPVSPAPDSLLDGQEITFRPSDNGSSSATINVIGNGGPIGAKQWVLSDGTSDVPDDYVKTNRDYKVRYNSSTGKMVDQDLGLFSNNPSIQAWNTHIDYYKVPSYVTGSDALLYKSISQTGPNLGGSHNPVSDAGVHWTKIYEASYVSAIGSIAEFATILVPTGHLLCDGSAVSRTTYADLFGVMNKSAAATMTIASPCVVTWTAHGLQNGYPVKFSTTGALPTGLVAGTTYWIINKAADTFNVAATPGASAINTTGSQSGVHTAICSPFGYGDGSTTFNVPEFRGEFARGWDYGRGIDTNRGYGAYQADEFKAHSHLTPVRGNSGFDPDGTGIDAQSDTSPTGYPTSTDGGTETRPRNQTVLICIKY